MRDDFRRTFASTSAFTCKRDRDGFGTLHDCELGLTFTEPRADRLAERKVNAAQRRRDLAYNHQVERDDQALHPVRLCVRRDTVHEE